MQVKTVPKYVFYDDAAKPAVACELNAVDGCDAAHIHLMVNPVLTGRLFNGRWCCLNQDVVESVGIVGDVIERASAGYVAGIAMRCYWIALAEVYAFQPVFAL